MDEKTRIFILFLKRPILFSRMISLNYPFDYEMLCEYEYLINWDLISHNRNVKWSEQIIDTFLNKLNFYTLIDNPNLPWGNEFIEKYENLFLAGLEKKKKRNIIGNHENSIKEHIDGMSNSQPPFYDSLINKNQGYHFCGYEGSSLYSGNPNHEKKYADKTAYSEDELIGKLSNSCFFQEERYHWRKDDYYQHNDCCRVYCNSKLNLTPKILRECKHLLNWLEVSRNTSLEITEELILEFFDEWNFGVLGRRLDIEWNLRLIELGINKWDIWSIEVNPRIWEVLCSYIDINWLKHVPVIIEDLRYSYYKPKLDKSISFGFIKKR